MWVRSRAAQLAIAAQYTQRPLLIERGPAMQILALANRLHESEVAALVGLQHLLGV